MRRSFVQLLVGAVALAAPVLSASNAFADYTCQTADGPVTISDITQCSLVVDTGGCSAMCTPINYTLSCNAQCTGSISADCTSSCNTSCMTACMPDPAMFSCSMDCESQCTSNMGDMSSCTGECETSCMSSPPGTSCATACQDDCNGSCQVQANLNCDASCQSNLQGGCTANCSTPSGAVFCNGQFVDVTSLSDCTISVTIPPVSAGGSASASCAAAPLTGSPYEAPAALGMLAGLGLFVARRRRHG